MNKAKKGLIIGASTALIIGGLSLGLFILSVTVLPSIVLADVALTGVGVSGVTFSGVGVASIVTAIRRGNLKSKEAKLVKKLEKSKESSKVSQKSILKLLEKYKNVRLKMAKLNVGSILDRPMDISTYSTTKNAKKSVGRMLRAQKALSANELAEKVAVLNSDSRNINTYQRNRQKAEHTINSVGSGLIPANPKHNWVDGFVKTTPLNPGDDGVVIKDNRTSIGCLTLAAKNEFIQLASEQEQTDAKGVAIQVSYPIETGYPDSFIRIKDDTKSKQAKTILLKEAFQVEKDDKTLIYPFEVSVVNLDNMKKVSTIVSNATEHKNILNSIKNETIADQIIKGEISSVSVGLSDQAQKEYEELKLTPKNDKEKKVSTFISYSYGSGFDTKVATIKDKTKQTESQLVLLNDMKQETISSSVFPFTIGVVDFRTKRTSYIEIRNLEQYNQLVSTNTKTVENSRKAEQAQAEKEKIEQAKEQEKHKLKSEVSDLKDTEKEARKEREAIEKEAKRQAALIEQKAKRLKAIQEEKERQAKLLKEIEERKRQVEELEKQIQVSQAEQEKSNTNEKTTQEDVSER